MLSSTLSPLLLLAVISSYHASLVKVGRRLQVRQGQWVYLQERDLQFQVPQVKDSCKVEVVPNEPITQRVGKLVPQVFDCHYQAEQVKYVHNGCPLLKEDIVKLRLYRLTESETYMEVFTLHIDILEPDCNLIRLGSKPLQVPEFYGLSDSINGNVLALHFEKRSSLECSIHLRSHDTPLPRHGRLVTGEPQQAAKRGDEPESFIQLRDNKARAQCKSGDCLKGLKLLEVTTVPCEKFLMMGIKYQHTDPPSPNIDYIFIRLELRDTRSGSIYTSEQAWIPVQIASALPNHPPTPSFMSTFILEADQFILTPLSTATLDAEDEETPKQLLVFNITSSPAEGFITHLSGHTCPIFSFTWLDLNEMLIGYQPPNTSDIQRRNYEVEIEAHDFFFQKSSPMRVHLSVRTADTNAPRVSWNMGLSLLEGQSRLITWEQLQIVDNDDLKAVRIIIVDGLLHGKLTVRGRKALLLTVDDIKAGVVRYHHDDSDSTEDFIIFRITDGLHQTRHKFPIKILPKDDSPPFLISNMLMEASEGQVTLLRGSSLQAADMDSNDDYILFNITSAPKAGEVIKVPGPGLTGYPVGQFLQKDLFLSSIYYRHLGNKVFEDFFEVVLSDFHDPPNLSEPQVVMLHIQPAPEQPPEEVPGSSRCLVIKETEVVHITRKQLNFIDQHSSASELIYSVTTPPFYTGPHGIPDAGRLFLVDTIPRFTKHADAPALRVFTQDAVNFMKVAYMPPVEDIGPYPKNLQFVLSVTNHAGKTVPDICFNITVMPVNNQPPQVMTAALTVEEGGGGELGPEHLLLSDVDSLEESLQMELQKKPQHGSLLLDGLPLEPGQTIRMPDLKDSKVRYNHDNTETTEDTIEFTATDGANSVHFNLQVKVLPVNDEVPVLVSGLKPVLSCEEGQEVFITAEYLCAVDADSDNNSLAFLIARQPQHGMLLRGGVIVDRFIQQDVVAGIITYKHTGVEVGLSPQYDTITFVISDGETETSALCCGGGPGRPGQATRLRSSLPVYDLHITVLPVDNHTPSLTAGGILSVDEGGDALITASYLTVSDVDTDLERLVFSLISQPQFGYIENVLPSPGFERSNSGISIASFSYKDVIEGHINYIQSKHKRMEPTADQFLLCVSDDHSSSAHVPFHIVITPTNDEIPEFVAHNITVREGGLKQLDSSVLYAEDLDVPKEVLRFSVIREPQHGRIMTRETGIHKAKRKAASSQSEVVDFTSTDLTNGLNLMYMHDGSETLEDSFTIQVTDGRHKLQRQVLVGVLPENDEEPHIIRNTGLEVEPGGTRLISSASLLAVDRDNSPSEVMYIFDRVSTQGLLQLKEGQDWVTLRAGRNCTQEMLDLNLLRYTHTDHHISKKQDFFVFHLVDGDNQSPPLHFQILIKDLEKGNIAVFTKLLNVSRGDRVILNSEVLRATDGTDEPAEIQYVITSPPTEGHIENIGHMGNIGRPRQVLSTFSQLDIAASVIAYVHDRQAGRTRDIFRFVVSNGKTSRNGSLEIKVELEDRVLPSLSSNQGMMVPQGSSMILGPELLSLSDPDTPPSALTFILQEPPQFGRLFRTGTPLTMGSSFTQRNLEDLEVTYSHDGGPSLIDRFAFTGSDSTSRGFLLNGQLHTEPMFFTIQIRSLGKSPPEVVKLLPLWNVESFAHGQPRIYLSSHELKAEDGVSKEEELTFHIIRPPYFGFLENVTTGGFVSERFSQMDLSKRSVAYVINVEKETYSDSLVFRVSDALGNMGPSHRLDFKWSSVEFLQSEMSVCENQGTLSLDIIRKGNLAKSAFITAKVKTLTGTEGKDFLSSSSSLIQFDPGMQKQSWRTEIIQDDLEEAEEALEVLLVSPQGTLIGGINRTLITIQDLRSGQCRRNLDREDPVLGGEEIRSHSYPQHGSIQLENLAFRQDSILPSRGDGISSPKLATPERKLRVVANPKSIAPATVFHNGTDTIYTYHGLTQMTVEDDSSAFRRSRKAKIHVTGRGGSEEASVATKPKIHPGRKTSRPPDTGLTDDPSITKPCVPELMGLLRFNQHTNQLLHCDGLTWRRWEGNNQMAGVTLCPQAWSFHGGRCYILNSERKVTWSTANRACRERYKGTLASVHSKVDTDWLWDFSKRKPSWIGLSEQRGRGLWEWSGGEKLSYTHWRKSPSLSRQRGGPRCVLLGRGGRWQLKTCKNTLAGSFICSRRA